MSEFTLTPNLISVGPLQIVLVVSKIGLFGHYLEIAALDFADFAYYIRQEWYLTDLGGSSPQKKYLRLLWTIKACLQIIFLSPNSLYWLFIDKLFFILHILIDNNDFLLVLEVSVVKKFFEVQIEPIFDICPNYFCLQIHYLDFYLQAFFYFAYYDRKQWFLVGTGGFSRLNFFRS